MHMCKYLCKYHMCKCVCMVFTEILCKYHTHTYTHAWYTTCIGNGLTSIFPIMLFYRIVLPVFYCGVFIMFQLLGIYASLDSVTQDTNTQITSVYSNLLLLESEQLKQHVSTNRSSFIEIKSVATHSRWNVIHMEQPKTTYYTEYNVIR